VAPEVAMQVYRIVQEALTNVARHAQARRLTLSLRETDMSFDLRLADDGIGIDRAGGRPGSIGLFSMVERGREIGAQVRVQAAAGGGTEVLLSLPLQAAAERPSMQETTHDRTAGGGRSHDLPGGHPAPDVG
jgi:signal transduction histidine kinase